MKKKSIILFSIVSFIIFFTISCISSPQDTFATNIKKNNILYINVEIQKGEEDNYFLQIDEMDVKQGYSKSNFNNNDEISSTKVKCSFLDEGGQVIDIKLENNPLIESNDILIDDNGKLKNIVNRKDSGIIYAKTNYDERIKAVKIEMISSEGVLEEVGTVSIDNKKQKPRLFGIEPEFKVNKIIDNGSDEECINFVIMGDGFKADEQSKFLESAKRMANHIMEKPVYESNKDKFNIYAIEVISNESGVGIGPYTNPKKKVDTYFGCVMDFNGDGTTRLIYTGNYNKVYNTVRKYVPSYDSIMIVSNTEQYGGGGGGFAVVTNDSYSPESIVHELGHSFANLDDEYWYSADLRRPNVDNTNDPTKVKWKEFLDYKEIGIYQHSDYKGKYPYYKPSDGYCEMEYLNRPFCAVCLNAHLKAMNTVLSENGEDIIRPLVPQNIKVLSSTSNTVELEWDKSVDNNKIKEYEIYANDKLIDTTTEESYVAKKLLSGVKYSFYVKAKDISGNTSYESEKVYATIAGMQPATLKVNRHTDSQSEYTLEITASQADNRKLGWELYENGKLIRFSQMYANKIEKTIPFFNMNNGIYEYKVVVYDREGNKAESDIIKVVVDNSVVDDPILEWKNNINYKKGDKVIYKCKTYECTYNHISQIGWEPSPQVAALWKEVIKTKLEWGNNINYKIGDRVKYKGKTYECIYNHISQIGWEPGPQVTILWKEVSE